MENSTQRNETGATDSRPVNPIPYAIIGAGWAGLSLALKLSRQGKKVAVFEAAPRPGGRARSIAGFGGQVDNGQHLFIGAYQHVLQILEWLKIDPATVFFRQNLRLHVQTPKGKLSLNTNQMQAPSHLLWALTKAQGLSISDKVKAVKFCYSLKKQPLSLANDCSVKELLQQHQQSPQLINHLWGPLALASMTTPIEDASANVFTRVLRDSFYQHRDFSDFLFPRVDLSQILPDPIARQLLQNGSSLHLNRRVNELWFDDTQLKGIIIQGQKIPVENVIFAIPPWQAERIFAKYPQTQSLSQQLGIFKPESITTVYTQYPTNVRLPELMVGCSQGMAQWVFDRRICKQPGLLATVVSGPGLHNEISKEEVLQQISVELDQHFAVGQPLHSQVIREKRAAFSCNVSIDEQRPKNRTAVPGLWLAGDFTQTGYPSTLEGAVMSGLQCADMLLATANSQTHEHFETLHESATQ